MRGWVFELKDKAAVIEIIKPRKPVQ